MKQILLLLAAMLLTCCSKNGEVQAQTTANNTGKVLVAYFSFTSNTKGIAEKLAEVTGGDIYCITPAEAYGSENSNYYDETTRAYQEQYGPASVRPALKETLANTDYDVVLLGFPIWYGKVPRLILTFLDKYGFEGKTVIPFCTSGSSGISAAENELHNTYPGINWKEGARLNGKSKTELKEWYESFGLTFNNQLNKMYITIDGGQTLTATLADNTSAQALMEALNQAPITYEAHDYGDFEKVGTLGQSFPENNESITTEPGDIILYQGSSLCLYYDTNTWTFTRIGKIEDKTQAELKQILKAGQGKITVTLSLSNSTGISSVRSDSESGVYYSLNGLRVENPSKGIYIRNGKKIIL